MVMERVSRVLITAGGLGTILAVSLVFLFLAQVVIPLFLGATVEEGARLPAAPAWKERPPERIAVDPYMTLGWAYFADGIVEVFRLDTGEVLSRHPLFPGGPLPTAVSLSSGNGSALFGFADGTVRFGRVRIAPRDVDAATLPEPLRTIGRAEFASYAGGLLERTPEGQLRHHVLETSLEEPIRIEPPSRILKLDHALRDDDTAFVASFVALTEDGRLVTERVRGRKNMLTGKVGFSTTGGEMHLPKLEGRGAARHVLLSGVGDSSYVVYEDGLAVRVDLREITEPRVAEMTDLLPEPDVRITALRFMIGKTTLVAGDSLGRVRAWFPIKPEGAGTIDGATLAMAHEFEGGGRGGVTAIAASERSRMVAAANEGGSVRLFHLTSQQTLAEVHTPREAPVSSLTLSPKDRGIVGTDGVHILVWNILPPPLSDEIHPEITLASLFLPVWYEGYAAPDHTWQSSSGTDEFEPKFGLWKLVFGTIKATFYSMLFGAPLAILAAIFTSEFLSGRAKSRVKPLIEIMASLPSVVLGFLAANVIAPYVQGYVPETLTCFVTIPFVLLLGAGIWQALPGQGRGRVRVIRVPFLFVAAALGVGLGFLLGPLVERTLFAGDIMRWLDGQAGEGTGGWMLLLIPLSAVAVALLMAGFINPALRRVSRDWGPGPMARFELVKFLAGAAAVVGLAFLLSMILNAVGWDPRGSFVAKYDQRNALIVGFLMGFAIIPIIYTISEDALSSVPEHLRTASLGAGATQWQTAVRIIIPTALSGIFSALMVGFGRAVGETMIVLMATGNTPVDDWNIFNGFRTLSANIAVEMPEAVKNSTHYRTLFLAALALFAITFLVNTVAEAVRLRVRKKAYEL
jgi:phosphate transport system permease protein